MIASLTLRARRPRRPPAAPAEPCGEPSDVMRAFLRNLARLTTTKRERGEDGP